MVMTYLSLYRLLLERAPSDFEARLIFEEVLAEKIHNLPEIGDKLVSQAQTALADKFVAGRKEGIPLQYLIGRWSFYKDEFFVGPGVLIPRAETELIIDIALEILKEVTAPKILDLCSGSGAIAITLAKYIEGASVTAVELSELAFSYLKKNIAFNNVEVFAVLGDVNAYHYPEKADLIVCNPPYIKSGELATLQREVLSEPSLALDGGEDGLDFYRKLVPHCKGWLKKGGTLCFELGAGQSADVAGFLLAAHYKDVTVTKDLGGIDRVITAKV